MRQELINNIKAGFPLISMQTVEIERALKEIGKTVGEWNEQLKESSASEHLKAYGYNFRVWSATQGWVEIKGDTVKVVDPKAANVVVGLKAINDTEQIKDNPACVYVLQNVHLFWDDPGMKPIIAQHFLDFASRRTPHQHVIVVGAFGSIPPEIASVFMPMDFALPNKEGLIELVSKFDSVLHKSAKLKVEDKKIIADAGAGMTSYEFENAVRVAIVQGAGKKLDHNIIQTIKAESVKKMGFLEHEVSKFTIDDVGGNEHLKRWLSELCHIYHHLEEALKYGLKTPKGCMVTGISGTGKSLVAKVIAKMFGVPLFRADIGKLFGSLVGQTEQNTVMFFKQIDAVSPCVILLDEIEKSLSGMESSGASDAGVTSRLIGRLLTYLQDKVSSSFFVATANDITKLPPELLRKGRFNEIWFVDLPDENERKPIFTIHLSKTGRPLESFDIDLLVKESQGATGAEIEGFIDAAMIKAFSQGREFNTKDIVEAIQSTPFLSKTKEKEIKALREWAVGRARIANVDPHDGKNPAWYNDIILGKDKEPEAEAA